MLLFRNHCNDFALLDNKKKFLYYLIASEICLDKKDGMGGELLYLIILASKYFFLILKFFILYNCFFNTDFHVVYFVVSFYRKYNIHSNKIYQLYRCSQLLWWGETGVPGENQTCHKSLTNIIT